MNLPQDLTQYGLDFVMHKLTSPILLDRKHMPTCL